MHAGYIFYMVSLQAFLKIFYVRCNLKNRFGQKEAFSLTNEIDGHFKRHDKHEKKRNTKIS